MTLAKRFCLLALAFLSTAALAQAQTGRITGTVVDTASSQPVASARITVVGTSLSTSTREDGSFAINNVPVGTHQLRIQRIGYRATLQAVTVGEGEVAVTAPGLAHAVASAATDNAIRVRRVIMVNSCGMWALRGPGVNEDEVAGGGMPRELQMRKQPRGMNSRRLLGKKG